MWVLILDGISYTTQGHIHSLIAYAVARSENGTLTLTNNALNSCPWLHLIMVSSEIKLIISMSYSAISLMKRDTLWKFFIKQKVDLWKFRHKAKDVCTIITYMCCWNLTYGINFLNPKNISWRDFWYTYQGHWTFLYSFWCILAINYITVHITMIRIMMIIMIMMMFINGVSDSCLQRSGLLLYTLSGA